MEPDPITNNDIVFWINIVALNIFSSIFALFDLLIFAKNKQMQYKTSH